MMKNWNEQTTNKLITEVKSLQEEHNSIKTKILKLVDEMETIEVDFNNINEILSDRLK